MDSIILGIVQGITEFLPVSSSAHLIVCSWLLEGKPIPLALNIAMHMGTTTAVLMYFWRDWLSMTIAALKWRPNAKQGTEQNQLLALLVVGSVPAGVLGILWQKDIERIFHHPQTTIIPLAVVGIAMWWFDRICRSDVGIGGIGFKQAILIGCGQAFALMPGVSRSGATITTSRLLGIKKEDAARFSFLLGTPAMAGAALINHRDIVAGIQDPIFYLGFFSSCIVGCFSIGFLMRYIRSHSFLIFAIYRVVLAGFIYFISSGMQ